MQEIVYFKNHTQDVLFAIRQCIDYKVMENVLFYRTTSHSETIKVTVMSKKFPLSKLLYEIIFQLSKETSRVNGANYIYFIVSRF